MLQLSGVDLTGWLGKGPIIKLIVLKSIVGLCLVIDQYLFFYNRYQLFACLCSRYAEPIFIYCYSRHEKVFCLGFAISSMSNRTSLKQQLRFYRRPLCEHPDD